MRTFRDYTKHAITSALGNLGKMGGDRYLTSVQPNELIEYYRKQYTLPQIVLKGDGSPRVIAEQANSSHPEAESAKVTIRFDVEEAPRIDTALRLVGDKQAAYTVQTDETGFYVRENLSVSSAKARLDELNLLVKSEIAQRNSLIEDVNTEFTTKISAVINQRSSKLQQQSETLKKLAQLIPIEFRAEPLSPIIPLEKRREIVVNPPARTGTFQSRIKPEILSAIIDVLIKGGRAFETTPGTFAKLEEEDLRNLLLSFLNGNFEIRAVGEAFNKCGKTDISLTFSGNNLFVAECKFWDGSKKYQDGIAQLFGYLTWRETIGVLLSFVKDKDFTSVIAKAQDATQNHSSFVNDSLTTKDASYFLSTHVSPDDKEKEIRLHHLLFHIYSPTTS